MKNYSKTLVNVPPTEKVPGRTDMVKNNAGGYVFTPSSQELLERFLTIGSEDNTYYVSAQKLTLENAENTISYIKTDGMKVLSTVVDFLTNRRAPKVDPGLFVLALLCTYGGPKVKIASYHAISQVCKTATHLFTFVSNVNNLRGWSRGLRNGVANWYTSKTQDNLAYQLVKYRNRAGFIHRDVLRLSHPVSIELNELFKYIVGKNITDSVLPTLIHAYEAAQHETEIPVLVELIKAERLTWEMVPTDKINNPKVLEALLINMPLTALIRNLNRFAIAGLTGSNTEATKEIVRRFSDKELVKKSGLHPVSILNAMRVYSSGRGDLGNKTWSPNQNIVDALDAAYYHAIDGLVPTNKSILVAVDVSGSMSNADVNKSKLTAKDTAAALSMSIMRSEPNAELIWFDTKVYKPSIGRRSSLNEILRATPNGGGTDCSLALQYALYTKNKYDAIVILTDNETWAGQHHAFQQLAQYRSINPDVKVIEIGMVANSYSTLPQEDKSVLRVAGFDSTVVQVLNRFIN